MAWFADISQATGDKMKTYKILFTVGFVAIAFAVLLGQGVLSPDRSPELKYYSGKEVMTTQQYEQFQQALTDSNVLNFNLSTSRVQIGEVYDQPVYEEGTLRVSYKVYLRIQDSFPYGKPVYKQPQEYTDIFGTIIGLAFTIALCFGFGLGMQDDEYKKRKGNEKR
jgi:hypothetical protein